MTISMKGQGYRLGAPFRSLRVQELGQVRSSNQVLIAIAMNVYTIGFVFRSAFEFYRANRYSEAY